jgi:hypothetical protein
MNAADNIDLATLSVVKTEIFSDAAPYPQNILIDVVEE